MKNIKRAFVVAFAMAITTLTGCGQGGESDGLRGVFYQEDMRWMTFEEFARRMDAGDDMLLLDVRPESAWDRVRIEGSINTHAMNFMSEGQEQDFINAIYPALLQADGRLVVVLCNSGSSGVRASWSRMADVGFTMADVYLLVGGVNNLQEGDAPFVIRD